MARTITRQLITACKQYCLAAGATQGNIAYTQNVGGNGLILKEKVTNLEVSEKKSKFE
jgi:hypothetical protein